MQVWKEIALEAAGHFAGSTVMIGNFDGLHLGHQALLRRARELTGTAGKLVVITFDPHPLQVLQPERGLKRLFPREDLAEQLPGFAADLLLILPFTAEFAQLGAQAFLDQYVGQPFRPAHIVAGYDFGFGKAREGSLESLRLWGERRGTALHVVPPYQEQGRIVSSRLLRELITEGRVDEAARLLGRAFYLRGPVVSGAGRGAKILFPTLNLQPVNETWPQAGVYVTRARWASQSHPAVTNIGVNPTFGGREGVKVETHVLGSATVTAPPAMDVEFVQRLRPEMKFASVEDLKKQIQSDILRAKEVLGIT